MTSAPAPWATVRVQLHRGFPFRAAAALVPYWRALGVGALYTSPLVRARLGSPHGYDVVDPTEVNPELGGAAGLAALTSALRAQGLGHIVDVVPNHMAADGRFNPWWRDVLEHGPASPYARFFDIDWRPRTPGLRGKVLLPVLPDHSGVVLHRGALRLTLEEDRFWLRVGAQAFPVGGAAAAPLLEAAVRHLRPRCDPTDEALWELESIAYALRRLPREPTARRREALLAFRRLAALRRRSPAVREALAAALAAYATPPIDAAAAAAWDDLLRRLPYRLAFWRTAAEEINVRRFFDVHELVGLRTEEPDVFAATHTLWLRLLAEGHATGLRIDHVDGLYDPPGYLERLQRAACTATGAPAYVVVEKILSGEERLRDRWPVAGTTGYDFLFWTEQTLLPPKAAAPLAELYTELTGHTQTYAEVLVESKREILRTSLVSELYALARRLDDLSERHPRLRDFTLGSLAHALRETIVFFPVYRTYWDAAAGPPPPEDAAVLAAALRAAKRANPGVNTLAFDFLGEVLLGTWPADLDPATRAAYADVVARFQQLTGPVQAKGAEDTAFYRYGRLLSVNEVGGDPGRIGLPRPAFDAWAAERAARWPGSLNATTTHDTKRSEDVRSRLHLLADAPEAWARHARAWVRALGPQRPDLDGAPVPDDRDLYFLLQTLLGVWPLRTPTTVEARTTLRDRLAGYLVKALREAKRHTSWLHPDEAYEGRCLAFLDSLLEALTTPSPFGQAFRRLQRRLAFLGALRSLALVVLKSALPGVPDFYQGQELFEFWLVDPDNRRPVDWRRRRRILARLQASPPSPARWATLARQWPTGAIKMETTRLALAARAQAPELYAAGAYLPVAVHGPAADHAFAFARTDGRRWALVAVPQRLGRLPGRPAWGRPTVVAWAHTALALPADAPRRWRCRFTGVEVVSTAGTLPLAPRFHPVPVLWLEAPA